MCLKHVMSAVNGEVAWQIAKFPQLPADSLALPAWCCSSQPEVAAGLESEERILQNATKVLLTHRAHDDAALHVTSNSGMQSSVGEASERWKPQVIAFDATGTHSRRIHWQTASCYSGRLCWVSFLASTSFCCLQLRPTSNQSIIKMPLPMFKSSQTSFLDAVNFCLGAT